MSHATFQIGDTVELKCMAGRGMFPHEAGVLIEGSQRNYEAMIDSDLLEYESELGDVNIPCIVKVGVVKVNDTKILVELPRQVVAGGRRIWVPQSQVNS